MKLVICEKPSVAQSIAAVIGAKQRQDGYLEGGGYIVSWGFGHLAEFASADIYNPDYAKWRYDDLPIVPETWQYAISRDKGKQFSLLRDLMNRADVTEIINACDAGREGELIFRNVYTIAGCRKPMLRLWISSMEDEAVRKGFAALRPGSEYDRLYASALCRAKADWLIGINATRLFSVLYHRTLNVGRVMSPTLAMVVQREAEIDAFVPKPFYVPTLECVGFDAYAEKLSIKDEADYVVAACQELPAAVKTVERKEKAEKAPLLYDLTTLQRDANRLLGYTAQQTLDYLQSLYEKKLCTYPRTDARFLTDDMVSVVPDLTVVSTAICGTSAPENPNAKQVCNSAKVSDHHAVVPTLSAKAAAVSALPTGELEILKLVARQLLCAVSEPFRYAETVVALQCAGYTFTAKGKTVISCGWKAYLPQEQQENPLPELCENQSIPVTDATVKEGKTTPPKHFTEDTLLLAMETAGAKEMPDDAERKGLGTPATRAATLEKLISTGFLERRKAKKMVNLIPVHTVISLITVLPEQLQSPLLTAEWESQLKQIECGELDAATFMACIMDMMRELVKTYHAVNGAEVLFPSNREIIGKCPRCGGNVTESKKGFFCERNDCRFGLWRDNKFLAIKKIEMNKKIAAALLKDGRVNLSGLYSEKTGKTYDAAVLMEDDGERTLYKLEFAE